jgi:hypothetical protein
MKIRREFRMPLPALVGVGLSLLPKIPEMWAGIAKIFGKETPQAAKAAAELRDTIMGDIKAGRVPPEQIANIEKAIMAHKEKMQELLLKEKELEVEREKLEYEDVKGVRELEMASCKVDVPYVRQTRPMILRRMFVLCCAYALICTALCSSNKECRR